MNKLLPIFCKGFDRIIYFVVVVICLKCRASAKVTQGYRMEQNSNDFCHTKDSIMLFMFGCCPRSHCTLVQSQQQIIKLYNNSSNRSELQYWQHYLKG